jgi:hypothetical protein
VRAGDAERTFAGRIAQAVGRRLAVQSYENTRSGGQVTVFVPDYAAEDDVAQLLAEFREQYSGGTRKETDMNRVNLNLHIVATLTDAATGKTEPTPFDAEMDFNYRGVPYADALDVQESFAQAMSEHGARMISKGRKHAEAQKAKA